MCTHVVYLAAALHVQSQDNGSLGSQLQDRYHSLWRLSFNFSLSTVQVLHARHTERHDSQHGQQQSEPIADVEVPDINQQQCPAAVHTVGRDPADSRVAVEYAQITDPTSAGRLSCGAKLPSSVGPKLLEAAGATAAAVLVAKPEAMLLNAPGFDFRLHCVQDYMLSGGSIIQDTCVKCMQSLRFTAVLKSAQTELGRFTGESRPWHAGLHSLAALQTGLHEI